MKVENKKVKKDHLSNIAIIDKPTELNLKFYLRKLRRATKKGSNKSFTVYSNSPEYLKYKTKTVSVKPFPEDHQFPFDTNDLKNTSSITAILDKSGKYIYLLEIAIK